MSHVLLMNQKNIAWTEEETVMIEAHQRLGNKWTEIAKCVPKRSENAVKNHWNATIRKLNTKKRMEGLAQASLLEEYIKNKYFNKRFEEYIKNKYFNKRFIAVAANWSSRPIQANPPPPTYDHNATAYFILESINEGINNDKAQITSIAPATSHLDDDSIIYLANETMRALFRENGNGNEINASNQGNVSSSNFSIV